MALQDVKVSGHKVEICSLAPLSVDGRTCPSASVVLGGVVQLFLTDDDAQKYELFCPADR